MVSQQRSLPIHEMYKMLILLYIQFYKLTSMLLSNVLCVCEQLCVRPNPPASVSDCAAWRVN